jgi:hypothetical protein
MVESLLRNLKQAPELQGPLGSELLDQGDAVAAWTGANLAAVLFPTAETLRQARLPYSTLPYARLSRGLAPDKHTGCSDCGGRC